jgi:8-oxo-dGTP pyrophosphatase MutT (NUDIX family)
VSAPVETPGLTPEESPEPKRVVDVVAAVRFHPEGGGVWLAKRGSDGMWEHPGGKVEPGEQFREALYRELGEKFPDVRVITIGRVLDCIDSAYEDTVYRVTYFEVMMNEPKEHPTHTEVRWMSNDEACRVDHLPSGTIFNARHLAHPEPVERDAERARKALEVLDMGDE